MTFIILTTKENTDYYLSTGNIAGVKAVDGTDVVAIDLQKGTDVKSARYGDGVSLQDSFLIYARKDVPKKNAASDLVAEITKAEQNGKTLDLRSRTHNNFPKY